MNKINMASQHCNCNLSPGIQYFGINGRFNKNTRMNKLSYFCRHESKSGLSFFHQSVRKLHGRPNVSTISCALDDAGGPDDPKDGADQGREESDQPSSNGAGELGQEINSGRIRDNLERIVGKDDTTFSGIDLATLIRNKYGRSYDVQLIKKEFMGRNLLAMNVMWKYMEQRSFPLTEEEYILRLDDIANNLKCWGAVSHIRNSLQNSKERPRIGKAVSIFIDMDESGGRANEWIYK